MPFKLQKAYDTTYIECDPSDFIIRNERDVLDLVGACSEYETHNVLLYEANLSPEFFDLKSGLAGAVLQKFVNYHMRGAAIISLDKVTNDRFKELIFEHSKSSFFRFFEDKEAAESWLVSET